MSGEQNPQQVYHQLLTISIVQKLKQQKGINSVKKLATLIQSRHLLSEQIIFNDNQQTYLVMTIGTPLLVTRSKQAEPFTDVLKPNSYCLMDQSVTSLTATKDTLVYLLSEKYIIDFFEGIISFPFINKRLDQLAKNDVFDSMERKKIAKIAFELEEVYYKIGTKIFIEEELGHGQSEMYAFFIVKGEVKWVRDGVGICVLGPTEILGGLNQRNQFDRRPQEVDMGLVITESAHLYKIKSRLLLESSDKVVQYANRRTLWREKRSQFLKKNLVKGATEKSTPKKRACFIDKEIAFRSCYGSCLQDLTKLKDICKPADFKCESREEFYSKKLDKLKEIQKTRYGSMSEKIVLFPIEIGRAYRNYRPAETFSDMKSSQKTRKIAKTEPTHQVVSPVASRQTLNFFATNL